MKNLDFGFAFLCTVVALVMGGILGREIMLIEYERQLAAYDRDAKKLYSLLDTEIPGCLQVMGTANEHHHAGN